MRKMEAELGAHDTGRYRKSSALHIYHFTITKNKFLFNCAYRLMQPCSIEKYNEIKNWVESVESLDETLEYEREN